jgi:hypothetical protein
MAPIARPNEPPDTRIGMQAVCRGVTVCDLMPMYPTRHIGFGTSRQRDKIAIIAREIGAEVTIILKQDWGRKTPSVSNLMITRLRQS